MISSRAILLTASVVLVSLTNPGHAKDSTFPKGAPMISIAVPEGWKKTYEDDRLYIRTEDDLSVVVEVSALEASKKEGAKALEEMKASVKSAFKNVTFKPMEEGSNNNVGLYIINGSGEDEDGQVYINAIMVTNGDNDQLFMVFIAAAKEGSEKYGSEIKMILNSIRKLD